ncbi:MAG: 4-hydroxy-3-methylbut-2-enyl diphosphate reductase [Alcaligenaceae bacterium]|nr:4-hydroxy-3-methylbut-2-enyl diphosphate reductase [Alcaligenaceae bacterium]
MSREILLAQPRGFCAGVDRAIDIVKRAISIYGKPIYVRHEIVHNRYVVDSLKKLGAIFIQELDEAPIGSIVIFSAHGVSKMVRMEAEQRQLQVFDATCPLVTKVHVEVKKMAAQGLEIIMVGHKRHPEVVGTLGQVENGIHLVENVDDVLSLHVQNPNKLSYVTQTTLSVDDAKHIIEALKQRFPNIQAPKKADICYATQNRQDAVKMMANQCDVFFVVGSINSSNSNRLKEVAQRLGCPAYLIDNSSQIKPEWIPSNARIGITAGASAPEILVQEVISYIKSLGAISVRKINHIEETTKFPLPRLLTQTKN